MQDPRNMFGTGHTHIPDKAFSSQQREDMEWVAGSIHLLPHSLIHSKVFTLCLLDTSHRSRWSGRAVIKSSDFMKLGI